MRKYVRRTYFYIGAKHHFHLSVNRQAQICKNDKSPWAIASFMMLAFLSLVDLSSGGLEYLADFYFCREIQDVLCFSSLRKIRTGL